MSRTVCVDTHPGKIRPTQFSVKHVEELIDSWVSSSDTSTFNVISSVDQIENKLRVHTSYTKHLNKHSEIYLYIEITVTLPNGKMITELTVARLLDSVKNDKSNSNILSLSKRIFHATTLAEVRDIIHKLSS